MSHLQKPYANFLEAKTLDSQAWKIYALLAIFKPFFRIVWPLDRRPFQITRTPCMKVPDDFALFWVGITEIPLTNRVRGPYRKLRTEFFPRRFMAQARSARAINRRGKKRGSVAYSTD